MPERTVLTRTAPLLALGLDPWRFCVPWLRSTPTLGAAHGRRPQVVWYNCYTLTWARMFSGWSCGRVSYSNGQARMPRRSRH